MAYNPDRLHTIEINWGFPVSLETFDNNWKSVAIGIYSCERSNPYRRSASSPQSRNDSATKQTMPRRPASSPRFRNDRGKRRGVRYPDFAAGKLHQFFRLEIFQHPRHRFARGAEAFRKFLVRGRHRILRASLGAF